jgi:cytochrome c oxidase assembly protein subunit 15
MASVVANVAIVVTGGAVRLTNSGLGCPTWPRCTDASLTPTKQYAIHGLIEFSNRMFTFVLVAIAVATWTVAMVRRRERVLATVAALGIPAQAVLGGFTVLTHLNPWLVGGHFLLSMVIIAVTFLMWWRLRDEPSGGPAHPLVRALAALIAAVVAVA